MQALEKVLIFNDTQELLDRAISVVDMRLSERPTLRLVDGTSSMLLRQIKSSGAINDRFLRCSTCNATWQAALQRGVIAVLDVGSTKIGCLILRFDGVDRNIDAETVGPMAGQSGFRVIGSATTRSRGAEFGEVVSMPEAERAIRTALQSAQKLAGVRVIVIASFSGARRGHMDWRTNHGRGSICNRATHCRSFIGRDVLAYGDGREVACATCTRIDHRSGLSDPRGQIGEELSTDMHMLTVSEKSI